MSSDNLLSGPGILTVEMGSVEEAAGPFVFTPEVIRDDKVVDRGEEYMGAAFADIQGIDPYLYPADDGKLTAGGMQTLGEFIAETRTNDHVVRAVLGRIENGRRGEGSSQEDSKGLFLLATTEEIGSITQIEPAIVLEGQIDDFIGLYKEKMNSMDPDERLQRVEDWIMRPAREMAVRDYLSRKEDIDSVKSALDIGTPTRLIRWRKYGLRKNAAGRLVIHDRIQEEELNDLIDAFKLDRDAEGTLERCVQELIGPRQYNKLLDTYGDNVYDWPPELVLNQAVYLQTLNDFMPGSWEDTVSLSNAFDLPDDVDVTDRWLLRNAIVFFAEQESEEADVSERLLDAGDAGEVRSVSQELIEARESGDEGNVHTYEQALLREFRDELAKWDEDNSRWVRTRPKLVLILPSDDSDNPTQLEIDTGLDTEQAEEGDLFVRISGSTDLD